MHEDCLLDAFSHRGEWFDLDCRQCKHPFFGQTGVRLASFALSQVGGENGVDSTTYATALENLATAFGRVGDYQKQKELLERALSINEREYGLEHVAVAATASSMSQSL